MSPKDIVKSNALIEAAYNPGSKYQMRLIMACLMQIKAKEKIDIKKEYFVTTNALAEITGEKVANNYVELKKAAESLLNMKISVTKRPNGEPGKPIHGSINVTDSCWYYPGEGKVGLVFTTGIQPYISELHRNFTKLLAHHVMPMRSAYGIRLYELCIQWLGDEREFEVDEFKRLFGLENKYKAIKDLKLRVIDPAIADVNDFTDLKVQFGQRKQGVRVTHLQFKISRSEAKTKLSFRKYVEQHSNPGESWEEAERRLKSEYYDN